MGLCEDSCFLEPCLATMFVGVFNLKRVFARTFTYNLILILNFLRMYWKKLYNCKLVSLSYASYEKEATKYVGTNKPWQ